MVKILATQFHELELLRCIKISAEELAALKQRMTLADLVARTLRRGVPPKISLLTLQDLSKLYKTEHLRNHFNQLDALLNQRVRSQRLPSSRKDGRSGAQLTSRVQCMWAGARGQA